MVEISSSMVRERVARRRVDRGAGRAGGRGYIAEHGLYRAAGTERGARHEARGGDKVKPEELVGEIARYAADKKAGEIVELDLRGVLGYTDYFLICTGNTERQTKAIHDGILEGCKHEHERLPRRVEGLSKRDWILMDYLDVVVHIFTPETRDFYRLEQLWGEVPARLARRTRSGLSTPVSSRVPRVSAVMREGERVTPLELFFDLVFVLALTQCTTLIARTPTWEGMLKGLLVLGMLWWSWVGYAWLTSVIDPEEGAVRLAMFAAMAAFLVAALCVPGAFGSEALLFACAYAAVRSAHIVLFVLASREDEALRHSVIGLAVSTAIGVGLIFAAAFTGGALQLGLWGLALVLDAGGPYLFGADGWKLVPGHFAERHGAIVIIALGESIVAMGIGAKAVLSVGRRRGRGARGGDRGDAVVGVLRRHRDRRRAAPGDRRRRVASATRSRATPTPTCTFRWSPESR